MAFLLEAQLQSLCGKKIPPNKNMSDIEILCRVFLWHLTHLVTLYVFLQMNHCNVYLLWQIFYSEAVNGAAVKHHENLASLLQLAVASASTWVELQGGGPAQFFPNKLRLGKIWLNGWLSGNVLGWRKFPNSSVKSSRTQLKYHSNVRNTVQEYKATHMDWKNFWKQERSLQHRALGNVAVHQIYLSTHHVHANHLEKSAKEIPILDWVSQ